MDNFTNTTQPNLTHIPSKNWRRRTKSSTYYIGIYIQQDIPGSCKNLLDNISGEHLIQGRQYQITVKTIGSRLNAEDLYDTEDDAIGLIACNSKETQQTIKYFQRRKIPVFSLFYSISSSYLKGHITIESFKSGRTAAWYIANFCDEKPKIGLLYEHDDLNFFTEQEIGFRSFLREKNIQAEITEINTDTLAFSDLTQDHSLYNLDALYFISGKCRETDNMDSKLPKDPLIITNAMTSNRDILDFGLTDISMVISESEFLDKIIQCVSGSSTINSYKPNSFYVDLHPHCIESI
ncbi:hypothetical protein [Vibrio viridaestus]|uniref:Uncharacterized protein n=1 Tax=Vibrio viridaestus TaxID=2487322 RepID=A0A3N9TJ68_9VIBR|nr:hypothetical protein [Vibrio viridaestus]RQW64200.1 hypothetical protein EES38_06325 [Vibrio viridaestus]